MEHTMRAEYTEDDPDRVRSWHMVRGTSTTAMCGKALRADAAARSDAGWGDDPSMMCHTCGALYLREVP
ncbi:MULTISPECIES: hypothetical protein [Streptomyces]|uniref:hypothetical protein n=1 Tax=Streptomyces TaxID=1883 RepID=UPI000CD4A80A|nr:MULTISPECIES: hypothetical protein [Streptomyces]